MRYLHVTGEADEVSALAHIHPVATRGAFVCSDPQLSRIWGVSAYTLRLCMQSLVLDGLKRDRMPWVGDQAISALANAFAFGDGVIARDSHLALGSPTSGYVNGISDYSLWWLITAQILRTYFPVDNDPLPGRVERFAEDLLRQIDDDGLFRPAMTHDGFTATNSGSVLIDWGYEIPDDAVSTALQMLWVWALDSVASMAGRETAARASRARRRALQTLRRDAWHAGARAWRQRVDGHSQPDSYANFLAVAAGVTQPKEDRGVVRAFADRTGRTPYMQTVLLTALLAAGDIDGVLGQIRRTWGEMLDHDTTTFWEEFPGEGQPAYEMYGRPYARSLCHAWGSGPAALLPQAVFGLRLLEPGWRRIEIVPRSAGLDWVAAVVPSPLGPIGLRIDGIRLELDLPARCIAVVGNEELAGPGSFVVDTSPTVARAG